MNSLLRTRIEDSRWISTDSYQIAWTASYNWRASEFSLRFSTPVLFLKPYFCSHWNGWFYLIFPSFPFLFVIFIYVVIIFLFFFPFFISFYFLFSGFFIVLVWNFVFLLSGDFLFEYFGYCGQPFDSRLSVCPTVRRRAINEWHNQLMYPFVWIVCASCQYGAIPIQSPRKKIKLISIKRFKYQTIVPPSRIPQPHPPPPSANQLLEFDRNSQLANHVN